MSRFTIIKRVEGEQVDVRNSVVGSVQGQDASLTNGMAGGVVANNDASLTQGAAGAIVAGRDMRVLNGGGSVLVAGRDLTLEGGGAGLMTTQNARLDNSYVSVLLSGNTELGENNRVLLNTPQAIGLGAAFGVTVALATFLLHWVVGKQER